MPGYADLSREQEAYVLKVLFLVCLVISASCFGNTVWTHSKALLAQLLIERAWGETLSNGRQSRPWPWADFWPVARIRFSIHDHDLYVLSRASGEALAFGPGHITGSALPATKGTSIIAGHRDTHFNFLKDIKVCDRVSVHSVAGTHKTYAVSGKRVVDSRTSSLLVGSHTGLTLVTCFPFDAVLPGGPLRLVVRLEEISETGTG